MHSSPMLHKNIKLNQLIIENARRVNATSVKQVYDSLPDDVYLSRDFSMFDVIIAIGKLIRSGIICDLKDSGDRRSHRRLFQTDRREYKKEILRQSL